jgi:hypothetical protein
MRKKLAVALVAALPIFFAAGCGESQQVIVYKQGKYQGKPDTQPWDNPQFKGDRGAWEQSINARNLGQDEYARSVPSAN